MRIGRLFGTDIVLDQSWFYFMLFMFVMNACGSIVQGFITLAILLLVFLSVLIHEYAHIAAGRCIGIRVPAVVLHIFGGAAMFPVIPQGKREIQISIAGPLCSLLLAGFCYLLLLALPVGNTLTDLIHTIGYINLILGGFNLLPIFPMDGGRVLRGMSYMVSGNTITATKTAVYTGWVMAPIFVFLIGLNVWTIIVVGFIFYLGYQELKMVIAKEGNNA